MGLHVRTDALVLRKTLPQMVEMGQDCARCVQGEPKYLRELYLARCL